MQINLKDLNDLMGHYVLQLDEDTPDVKLTDVSPKINLEFYLVKRVSLLAYSKKGVSVTDLYGNVNYDCTREDFVSYFNEYLGDNKGKRYHRLLTNKELDVVFDFIKSRNY